MRGGTARGFFLNAVAKIETELTAEVLLDICRTLEENAGRRRARFWGDRPLDLDILLVDGRVIETSTLRVPHPGIAQRPFVHRPLLEVWPDAVDARTGRLWTDAVKIDTPRAVAVSTLPWRNTGGTQR
ncbi:MAG: 2-amino-4-hydroxy-6-hydroxymethyldihydropteridine diphosphokinase [Myxococcota bacterium]|jgi:2-amino-4-hydroxy-6-hydroxymethyldihydropteridine diphosphokinase